MKGVILAGDSGDKLFPLSLGVPKQLLPIFDKPMIFYPIEILAKAGITDLLVITSPTQQKAFVDTLGDGHNLNVRIAYAIQQKPEGIAQAITIASDFIGIDQVCLITGDTLIFGKPFLAQLGKAIKAASKSANATIFVTDHNDGEQYGKLLVEQNSRDKKLVGIGNNISGEFNISGIYVYPNNVISKVKDIRLSERNRYEILDVNRKYLDENKLQIQKLDSNCIWLDTNSPENILKCSLYVQAHKNEI